MDRLPGKFGNQAVVTRRLLPGGVTNHGGGTGIQQGPGSDPVEIPTREKGVCVLPDTAVRVLQILPGAPQDRAPERHLGHARTVYEVKHGVVSCIPSGGCRRGCGSFRRPGGNSYFPPVPRGTPAVAPTIQQRPGRNGGTTRRWILGVLEE